MLERSQYWKRMRHAPRLRSIGGHQRLWYQRLWYQRLWYQRLWYQRLWYQRLWYQRVRHHWKRPSSRPRRPVSRRRNNFTMQNKTSSA
jgi:hypothetical protein